MTRYLFLPGMLCIFTGYVLTLRSETPTLSPAVGSLLVAGMVAAIIGLQGFNQRLARDTRRRNAMVADTARMLAEQYRDAPGSEEGPGDGS